MKLAVLLISLLPVVVHAATATVTSTDATVSIGVDTLDGGLVDISIDGQTQTLAAVDGGLYAKDMAAAATNVATSNPDFEAGDFTGWTAGTSWALIDEAGDDIARSTNGTGRLDMDKYAVTPGHVYMLQFAYRSSDSGSNAPVAFIEQFDSGDSIITLPTTTPLSQIQFLAGGSGLSADTSSAWVTVREFFVAQPTAATARPYFRIFSGAGTFDVDDVLFEDLDAGMGLLASLTAAQSGSDVTISGTDATLNLTLSATLTAMADHIKVTGTITDTSASDRAVQLGFNCPLDLTGWTWHDTVETETAIAASRRHVYYVERQSHDAGGTSLTPLQATHPFCAVEDGTYGLSLGHPMSQPRLHRTYCEQNEGVTIDYAFGLSTTTKTASQAAFEFVIYSHDEAWGLRSAAEKFKTVYPDSFVDRSPLRHGSASFGMPVATTSPEEFGTMLDFGGYSTARKALQDLGVYLMPHPMGWEGHFEGTDANLETAASIKTIIDNVQTNEDSATSIVNGGNTWTLRYSTDGQNFGPSRTALKDSYVLDSDGAIIVNEFSSSIMFVAANVDPEIADAVYDDERTWRILVDEAAAVVDGTTTDGVDFDNMTLRVGGSTARYNHNSAHFSLADYPLIYDMPTRTPCIYPPASAIESVSAEVATQHAVANWVTGNMGSDPRTAAIWGHWSDQQGGEFVWDHADAELYLQTQRLLAGPKPLAHILVSSSPEANLTEVFHVWLFLGAYPAIDGVNYRAGNFEAGDRTNCQIYVPTIDLLSHAGHQPVTYATADNADLLVERFGDWGDLYFTVHNPTGGEITATLTPDKTSLGVPNAMQFTDQLGGSVTQGDTLAMTIAANRSLVVRLDPVSLTTGQ